MKRRITSALLALCLMLTLLPTAAWAAEGTSENLTWEYDESTQTLTIDGADGQGEVTAAAVNKILDELQNGSHEVSALTLGVSVTSIGDRAFYSWDSIASVTVTGNIGSVGEDAFTYCNALEAVTFSGSVGSIAENAFAWCDALSSIKFGGAVESIRTNAFPWCGALSSIEFGSAVESIESGAFPFCDALSSVKFAGDAGSIGDHAFSGCDALTSVTFGGNVGSIGECAFSGCHALTDVTFSGDVRSIGYGAFQGCVSLKQLVIPGKVTSIGQEAFSSCETLSFVYIGGIGENGSLHVQAFADCLELKDIYFHGSEQEWTAAGGDEILQNEYAGYPIDFHPNAVESRESTVYSADELLELLASEDGTGTGQASHTNVQLGGDIDLGTDALTIPKGCNLVLDLNGHQITSGAARAVDVLGSLTVLDSADAGGGSIENTASDAIYVQPGRTFTLLSGTIKAKGCAITVFADRSENNRQFDTIARIEDGRVEAGGSAVSVLGSGAKADIPGGVLVSTGAPVISGSEAEGHGGTVISVGSATLTAQGAASGSLPCGIYHPQDGSITLRGTQISANGGIGVLMRGGQIRVRDSAEQAVRIEAGGSGKGTIGGLDLELTAGYPIVLDQKSECYNCARIRVSLESPLENLDDLKPLVLPADGFLPTEGSGTSSGSYVYAFRPIYTITFNVNDGQTSEPYASRSTDEEGRIEWPDDPVRQGYTFRGWGLDESTLAWIDNQEMYAFARSMTLYAKWVPAGTYIVTFTNRVFDQKVTGLDGVLLDWPSVPNTDYDGGAFLGWYTEEEGGEEFPSDSNYKVTKDTTVYAHWGELNAPFEITFDYNDSGTPNEKKTTAENGVLDNWPADPTRDGYIFKGWSRLSSYDIMPERGFAFYKDTTLYARWIPKDGYTITFHPQNGGDPVTRNTGETGVLTGWPDAPERTGYTFGGWYTDPDALSGVYVERSSVFQRDTSLYGYWIKNGGGDDSGDDGGDDGEPDTPKTYTVTFDANGGAGGATLTTGTDGKLASLPDEPTREGYAFDGWFTAAEGGSQVTTSTVFQKNTTVYAHWTDTSGDDDDEPDTPKTYTVTFDANGGTGGADLTTGTDGKLASLPDEPTREGYAFDGWFTAAEGGTQVDTSTVFEADTTVYAHWTEDSVTPVTGRRCTITFDPNGGTGGATLITGDNGRLIAPPSAPTRSGYIFDGWFTSASGGSQITTATVFDVNTTVYAHWTRDNGASAGKASTITFDPNGGTGGATLTTGTDGRLTALPANPTRAGYTFSGWYTAVSGGSQVTTSTVFQANATVYARWTQSGGGTSSSGGYYQIYTSGSAYGGSFSVSHTTADPGAVVTILPSPWSGYALSQLSAVRLDTGRALSLTRSGSQYSFVMPAANVQLGITFTQTSYTGGSSSTAQSPASGKPVNWYYSGGRIYHVTDGLVPVTSPLTRDMLISVLYNLDSTSSGGPTVWAGTNDIIPDVYASLLWGNDKSISREQTALILFCYAEYKGYNTSQRASLAEYTDSGEIRSAAWSAMSWARATGLITGTSADTLSPQANITCGQACTVLSRFVTNVI